MTACRCTPTLRLPARRIDGHSPRQLVTSSGDYPSWEGFLHGDTHSTTQRGDQANHVGIDAWNLTPVCIDIIAQILNEPN